MNVYNDAIEMFEDFKPTPLLRLGNSKIYAKLEFANPFSRSIKDRTAYSMIKNALDKGVVHLGDVLYEATSGNTGIALASLSNLLSLNFKAFVPKNTPDLTLTILKVFGANVVNTSYEKIDEELVAEVEKLSKEHGAVNLNQYRNENNPKIHYEETAGEIIKQLNSIGEEPEVLIAGIGTGGHLFGIGKKLKELYDAKIIGVIPRNGEKIPGIKNTRTNSEWSKIVDEVYEVTQKEAVFGIIEVARKHGIFVGLSSGAVYSVCMKLLDQFQEGMTIVLIFPDDGFKYVNIISEYIT